MARREVLAFVAFCVLGSSRWIVDSALPTNLPLFEQESLHYLGICLAAGLVLAFRKRTPVSRRVPVFRLAGASLLLLSLPALLGEVAGGGITSATRVALFALVPLFVVVGGASSERDADSPEQGRALMMPALLGFAGVLLMLPFQFPVSVSDALPFALAVAAALLTAAGSLWMHGLLQDCGLAPAVVMVCGANAVLSGMRAVASGLVVPGAHDLLLELLRCTVLDLPLLCLLVWLLQTAHPTRLAVRFLVIPLLTTLEGVTLFHSPPGLRMLLGMLLIVAGSGTLLFSRISPDESETTILPGLK